MNRSVEERGGDGGEGGGDGNEPKTKRDARMNATKFMRTMGCQSDLLGGA